ncbi:dicarboxylate/amino acid:cation symporter [Megasphaera paucivorans]|uniref:Na+/H+-dicarboxylate symporter n=1 Tax=Megasphaera paucivorans TaxID=349095 RepID=A0A1G9YNE2_9FIRM|nr:dicarboxylate/amino acid:cation symporter [Megasphaera paucivorans]SDN10679.1 Na+/H+-dicarboxylate symporter [Megasphaera paucivorans]
MGKIWKTYKSSFILLAAMIIGGVVGKFWGEGAAILQPIADLFLDLLYCCVVPLIFCSLTAAIAQMDDLSKLKKIMGTFLAGTLITGTIACLFMIIPAIIVNPGQGMVLDMSQDISNASGSMNLLAMFAVDDFPKLFSKANLMALIVFTVIFSIAIIKAGEKGKAIVKAMNDLTAVIVQVINIVMKLAPLGLGCYFAILIGKYGNSVVGPLGKGIVLYLFVVVVYFIVSQTVMAYIGAGKNGVKTWWKGAAAPALTALGTCSSAATLPVNLLHAKKIGIPADVGDLAIPLGANLHKDGACIIQILKISLLCEAFGINYVTPENIFLSIVVAVIASVVMGGIPAGGYVAEIFIVSVFGFPTVSIPIMVLIGTITDAPATVINVTGDTGLAMIISRVVHGKNWLKNSRVSQA